MAIESNFLIVGDKVLNQQQSSTNALKAQKLGLDVAGLVNDYSQYLLNISTLQIQQKQIDQANNWLELQKDTEIKNIETRTGNLISAQTSAYGFSGVTMSGSAVDTTMKTAQQGAMDRIYAEINYSIQKINNDYKRRQLEISEKATERQAITGAINSIGNIASGFGGK